jgi:hypothetical protein
MSGAMLNNKFGGSYNGAFQSISASAALLGGFAYSGLLLNQFEEKVERDLVST